MKSKSDKVKIKYTKWTNWRKYITCDGGKDRYIVYKKERCLMVNIPSLESPETSSDGGIWGERKYKIRKFKKEKVYEKRLLRTEN
jgi:hypothetical protein